MVPDAISDCKAPTDLPKLPSTQPTQRLLLYKPLTVKQTREKCYKEGWGVTRALQELQEFSRIEDAGESHYIHPFHLHRVDGNFIQVLWPTWEVITEHSQKKHPTSPFQLQTKEASRINKALLRVTGLPIHGYSVGQHPRHQRHLLSSN